MFIYFRKKITLYLVIYKTVSFYTISIRDYNQDRYMFIFLINVVLSSIIINFTCIVKILTVKKNCN